MFDKHKCMNKFGPSCFRAYEWRCYHRLSDIQSSPHNSAVVGLDDGQRIVGRILIMMTSDAWPVVGQEKRVFISSGSCFLKVSKEPTLKGDLICVSLSMLNIA